jgi:hypothetical protein
VALTPLVATDAYALHICIDNSTFSVESKMRITPIARALLALTVSACATTPATSTSTSAPTTAPASTSGVFVTTLGTDTLVVERYRRSGNKLEGDYLSRFQGARWVHYTADLLPDGRIRSATYEQHPLAADPAAPGLVTTVVSSEGSSVVTVQRAGKPDSAASGKRTYSGFGYGRFPGLPASAAIYEQLLIASHPAANDSVSFALVAPISQQAPATQPPPVVWISHLPGGGYQYHSTFFAPLAWTEKVTVDPNGLITAVDATAGTTVGTVTRRVSSVDFEGIRTRWTAMAKAGQLSGPASPPDTVRATVGAANVEIAYSRPFRRGRTIFGSTVVPWGQVWRTGANAATQLTTTKDIMIGGTHLPAGKYTLWTLPSETGSKLIINSQTGQWGTDYDPKRDFARVDLTTRTLDTPVEQFTISVAPAGQGGVLKLAWDRTEFSVPFTVM